MDQSRTPLFDRLIQHVEGKPISFHVPGHKNGTIFPGKGQRYYRDILKLDATELTGLDDLHSAEGVIQEAENLLSDLYRTERSFFLINGSTVGNLAMILSAVKEDDSVLVQRNSHKSIMNGLKLAKAQPVFLSPEYDQDAKTAGGIRWETVRNAISQHPDAKALILTYPNYYGMTYELKSIIELAHRHRIPVLVDEAHGVHFIAGKAFPESAVRLGADVVVQSAHKTLPAMTMGAYLHCQGSLLPFDNLQFYLQALQSSSPSYPLMASLDLARSYLGTYRQEDMDDLLETIGKFLGMITKLKGIRLIKQADPLKIVLQATGAWTGYELQHALESEGIFTELADPYNVLLVLPLLKKGMPHHLQEAAGKIAKVSDMIPVGQANSGFSFHKKAISSLAVSYRVMDSLETEEVRLDESIGRICAADLIPYPPGIPLCLRGERLSSEDIGTISYLQGAGAKIQGGESLQAGKIKVFKSWRM